MNRILVVDDEAVIRKALRKLLERHGYQVDTAESVEEALSVHDPADYHLLLVDIRLPGRPGTDLIGLSPAPVLVMTSYASVPSAVEAMKLGAADYVAKPFDHEELLLVIRQLIRNREQERSRERLKSDLESSYPVNGMVGRCAAMRALFEQIDKVAPTDASVLVLGESGTGKELVARAIHEQSRRQDAPFVAVNCATIPENLVESELFGHVKGAFTGADRDRAGLIQSADSGTLFLDEIAELPLAIQARLLRVLQDGELRPVGSEQARRVDVRLIAATNRNLRSMVEQERFRGDLYFRLRVVELAIPPLRERGGDITLLADHLLEKACRRLNRPAMSFTPRARDLIRGYHWPGNVRELENAVERAAILADGDLVEPDLLGLPVEPRREPDTATDLSLDDYFRRFVLEHQQQLTETELARRLGISRKTLWQRRQRLGIPRR